MTEQEQSALHQGHGNTLDDYVELGPAEEEIEAAAKTLLEAYMKTVVKAVSKDPIGAIRAMQSNRAKKETDEWSNHRTTEGIA